MRLSAGVCICAAALSVAVACSSNDSTSSSDATGSSNAAPNVSASASSTSPRPTLTDPKIQPPSQLGNQYADGLANVVFDPCTWISDQTIKNAGFNPASRARLQDMVAEQTFLTCTFDSTTRSLNVNSGNVPWEQDLQKNAGKTEAIAVNGRQAIWIRNTGLSGTCEIDLRTKVGFVQILASLTENVNVNQVSACDGLLNTATLIEPEIGKGN